MVGEFGLIARLHARWATPQTPALRLGSGDDAAWLGASPERGLLVTTDTLVEGVHFRLDWSTPRDVGFKALATNLSDIAAMGGRPSTLFLNLTLPRQHPNASALAESLLDGMVDARDALVPSSWALELAGGDTTRTDGPLVITLTLMGPAPTTGPITRSGARLGDRVVLCGEVGLAGAGLAALTGLLMGACVHEGHPELPALLAAHRRPRALVRLGDALGAHQLVTAMIDVSDGLIQDAGHLARCSHVALTLHESAWTPHPQLLLASSRSPDGRDDLASPLVAWSSGDDYALLMTARDGRCVDEIQELCQVFGVSCHVIGDVTQPSTTPAAGEGASVTVLDPCGRPRVITRRGYQHL